MNILLDRGFCSSVQSSRTFHSRTIFVVIELWLTNLLKSLDIGFKCMKLQNPERVHSPISYWRQHASRKSVTGDNSEYTGRPPNQRLFISFAARSASSSRRNYGNNKKSCINRQCSEANVSVTRLRNCITLNS